MASSSDWRNPSSPNNDHEKPEVVAPSVNITAVGLDGQTRTKSGTSFAAPMVTGEAALLMHHSPLLETWPEAQRAIIMASATHNIEGPQGIPTNGTDYKDGVGGINADLADQIAQSRGAANSTPATACTASCWWGEAITPSSFTNGVRNYYFQAQAGDRVRVAASWWSNSDCTNVTTACNTDVLSTRLGLTLVAPDGTAVSVSNSWDNNYELVPPDSNDNGLILRQAGTYTIRISQQEFSEGSNSLGVAWVRTSNAYGWSYQEKGTDGSWHLISAYNPNGTYGQPEWHDPDGGWVWPTQQHPGQGPDQDTARVWTAPQSGTVAIISHASKLFANGNGVRLTITKNGTAIWGPQDLVGTDLVGVDANVSNVPVVKGDTIRFEVNNRGDWNWDTTRWDPVIANVGTQAVFSEFTTSQGSNGWTFQDNIGGTWQNIQSYITSGHLYMPQWNDPARGFMWPMGEHPGVSNDTARTWTSNRAGTFAIISHVGKMNGDGNGVQVRITKNGATIWGPMAIAGSNLAGVDADVPSVSIVAGDLIRFEINNNGAWDWDATRWEPVLLSPGTLPASRSFNQAQGYVIP